MDGITMIIRILVPIISIATLGCLIFGPLKNICQNFRGLGRILFYLFYSLYIISLILSLPAPGITFSMYYWFNSNPNENNTKKVNTKHNSYPSYRHTSSGSTNNVTRQSTCSQKSFTSNIGGYSHNLGGGDIYANGVTSHTDIYGNIHFDNGEVANRTSSGGYLFSDGTTGYEDSYGNIILDNGQTIYKH